MDVNLLIGAIVRQTMVMIAQLATAGGVRTPLARVADRVFMDLINELQTQGLGRKVIADMFGLTLRAYHAKVRRLSESATQRGCSLWEVILGYVQDKKSVSTVDIMQRFSADDETMVRGVLNDLCETGLVIRTGRGPTTRFQITRDDEIDALPRDDNDAHQTLVWVTIHRHGPITGLQLRKLLPLSDDHVERAVVALVKDGRVQYKQPRDQYDSRECVIPLNSPHGWEAALLDHFQSMTIAIGHKVQKGRHRATFDDHIGGSTYHFDVSLEHPLADETLRFLQRIRREASELRKRVDHYNQQHPHDREKSLRVIFYAGQTVIADDQPNDEQEVS